MVTLWQMIKKASLKCDRLKWYLEIHVKYVKYIVIMVTDMVPWFQNAGNSNQYVLGEVFEKLLLMK